MYGRTRAVQVTPPRGWPTREDTMRTVAHALTTVLLVAAIGCGSSSATKDGGGQPGTGDWIPLKVGNSWTYQVTEVDGTVSAKVQGVTASIPVGGTGPDAAVTAFKLVTGDKFNDTNGDVSFQKLDGTRYVRYRELSIGATKGTLKKEEYYTPAKLRLDTSDDKIAAGKSWAEAYTDFTVDTPKVSTDGGADAGDDAGATTVDAGPVTTSVDVIDVWTVIATKESVTVPAGTFDALVVERVGNSGASDKKFWFVRGIGKVKETGASDQTEELSSYTIK
jgi:hypothetical protein